MNALIFAAGLGTRLKPLTDTMPKAMVPVNGKPLIQILIEKLKGVGVTHIVVNVHHFAQQIIDFVEAHQHFGIDIQFSDETDMLLETGGGLKKAAHLFPDYAPILVHNVDILSNADLLALYNGASATTLLVSERETQRYLLFDDGCRLVGWTNLATGEVRSPFPYVKALEKELTEGDCAAGSSFRDYRSAILDAHFKKYAFSGIQVFHPSLLPLMESWKGKFSIIDFYLSVCDKVPICGCFDPGLRLLDVGKLDTIAKAEAFIA